MHLFMCKKTSLFQVYHKVWPSKINNSICYQAQSDNVWVLRIFLGTSRHGGNANISEAKFQSFKWLWIKGICFRMRDDGRTDREAAVAAVSAFAHLRRQDRRQGSSCYSCDLDWRRCRARGGSTPRHCRHWRQWQRSSTFIWRLSSFNIWQLYIYIGLHNSWSFLVFNLYTSHHSS